MYRAIPRCLAWLTAVTLLSACDGIADPVGQNTADPGVVSPATPAPATPSAPASSSNPLAGARFFVDPESQAQRVVQQWRSTRPADAAQLEKIASQPQAFWLGEWYGEPASAVNTLVTRMQSAGAMPVIVLYNIPQRDCGLYSAGGASSAGAYRTWINAVASGLKQRKAVLILEPDAIAGAECLSNADQETRFSLIRDAVATLTAHGALVYIDAGHPGWHTPAEAAALLVRAGITGAQGFALNVSNFHTTSTNAQYGAEISRLVGGKHFLIDTSRSGLGPGSTWCNPDGRALGAAPSAATGHALVDAYLWVKRPGESDGTCNGGPAAGQFWAEYALGLAKRTN